MMNPNFYSQSFNFTSAVLGGVDPRTGLFNVNMPLANLVGNDNLGPSLDLSLCYNPLSDSNLGFGKGCSIGLSHYDTQAKLLTLSTGERYKVTEINTQPIIQQKKLDNFRFEKQANAYKIIYKSGVVEILLGPQTVYDVKVPLEIYSPLGRKLSLKWVYTGGKPRLSSVADEKNTLLEISYPDHIYVDTRVKVWPGTAEEHEMVFKFRNDYLTQVDNNALREPLSWKFGYDAVDESHYLITKVEAPTGLIDQVYYKAGRMKFPDNAHLPALPCVSRYVQYPGFGQPAIETLYEYSDRNYLGYGSTVDWDPDRDNLYGVLDGYEYYSREIYTDQDRRIQTKRTYNNFHLLTQDEVSQDSASRTTQTEYYAKSAISFDKQPAQFQLPKKQTLTYKDTSKPEGGQSRSEVTTTEFDDAGNLTKKITPDGTTTEIEYYDKTGEEGCPADPNGFVRFIKKQTVSPSSSDFLAPIQSTEYICDSFPPVANSLIRSVVLLAQEKYYSDEKPLLKKSTAYVNAPASGEHGRIGQIKSERYDLNAPGKSYVNQQDFVFKIEGEVLLQEASFRGHDGLSSNIKKEQSLYSGKLISETDSQGNKTVYTYDQLGRILTRTLNPGTEYENTITTAYSLVKDDQGEVKEISTTQSDPKGNKSRTYFDALGRTIKQSRNDRDSAVGKTSNEEFIEILRQDYDKLGRKRKVNAQDFMHSIIARRDGPQQMALDAELFYNNWGENHLLHFSDGHKEYTLYDPIAMESTTYIQAEDTQKSPTQGKQVVKYNKQGLPIRTTHLDASGNEKGIINQRYDGLGQLRELTDELGHVTRYEYDALGRVVTQGLSDGTIIRKTYAQHTSEPLISGISVTDNQGRKLELGAQSFDSLGRLISSDNGGRKYQYQYEGISPKPSRVTTPAGESIIYHYIPQLGNALQKLEGDAPQQVFTYDKLTGLLTAADQNGGMARRMTYKPSGLLEKELFSPLGEESQEVSYTYSLLGKLGSYVDVSGAHQSYGYDIYGRHILKEDPLVKVEFGYDKLGRLIERKATNKGTGDSMRMVFTYDDFNREIKRQITFNDPILLMDSSYVFEVKGRVTLENSPFLVIESSYRLNGQLEYRTTKRYGTTLRQEDFTYDVRNRLQKYTCSGTELPLDAYGKAIKKQSFTYDALGNIKECVTEFEGGSDVATFHYDNAQDPTQLTSVSHTHADYPRNIQLQYDANGRLIHDEASRSLSYDALGRLITLSVDGSNRGSYSYDAFDRLVGQKVDENDQRELYYLGETLVNEIHRKEGKKQHIRLIKDGGATIAIHADTLELTATDAMGSLLSAVSEEGAREDFRYSPYGSSARRSSATSLVGFNGERMDPISGTYHLGNGYRAYNPVLMRFNCPDSLSPFGPAGINPYIYCAGDPINRLDPSGHLSWQAWLGIGLGIVGVAGAVFTAGTSIAAAGGVIAALESASATSLIAGGLGLAADVSGIASGALEEANPQASAILGWVSLGTGLGSIGTLVGKGAYKFASKTSQVVEAVELNPLFDEKRYIGNTPYYLDPELGAMSYDTMGDLIRHQSPYRPRLRGGSNEGWQDVPSSSRKVKTSSHTNQSQTITNRTIFRKNSVEMGDIEFTKERMDHIMKGTYRKGEFISGGHTSKAGQAAVNAGKSMLPEGWKEDDIKNAVVHIINDRNSWALKPQNPGRGAVYETKGNYLGIRLRFMIEMQGGNRPPALSSFFPI